AHAKCDKTMYDVAGLVLDANRKPVEATVDISWTRISGSITEHVRVDTDRTGQFSAHIPFYSWSSTEAGRDVCEAILKMVSVGAEMDGCWVAQEFFVAARKTVIELQLRQDSPAK